jgi:glycerate dehydrogenase
MPQTIVFLDRDTLRVPCPTPGFEHRWIDYPLTPVESVIDRANDATVIITNKVRLSEEALSKLPALKLIAVAATGFDCVDVASARARGVTVCNVPGYSQHSVPEHVFMLILALRRQLPAYTEAVRSGQWQSAPQFAILDFPIRDLAGSTLGIIGYGDLGQRVAALAKAFGMDVLLAERKGAAVTRAGRTAFGEVLRRSDVVSLHNPMTPEMRGMIGAAELALMKRDALLINTARGGLVDETALAEALKKNRLGGAGIDVLTEEPPRRGNPLLELHLPNLIVTPHVAWSSLQAQTVLAAEIVKNIEAFVAGQPRNVVS